MMCQHCQLLEATTSYLALGGFFWDRICDCCKDRMKLDDWNESCRRSIHYVEGLHREKQCHPSESVTPPFRLTP